MGNKMAEVEERRHVPFALDAQVTLIAAEAR
jgi:hypothetical protein